MQIDTILGELLPYTTERLTRGYSLSCVWGRPHRLVWAQSADNFWVPGMVIAGNGVCLLIQTILSFTLQFSHIFYYETFDQVPGVLAAVNFSRIPNSLAQRLINSKPTGSSSKIIFCGHILEDIAIVDEYVLVEFFGTHDFGWVQQDHITLYPENGSFQSPLSFCGKQPRFLPPTSSCMIEAQKAYSFLRTCDAFAKVRLQFIPNLL
jgi:hypothetical protein